MLKVLVGDNSFMIKQTLNQLKSDFLKDNSQLLIEQYDLNDDIEFSQVLTSCFSPPFLANKKLVIASNIEKIKDLTENDKNNLTNLADFTDLIMVGNKLDKRSSVYKFLIKLPQFKEFNNLSDNELVGWLVNYATSIRAKLSRNDANYLIERVGSNQLILSHEIDKLKIYSEDINRQSIDLLTVATPRSTIFNLIDAAFSGNDKTTIKLYDEQQALRVEPAQIIALLTWQLNVLSQIKLNAGDSDMEIAKKHRINPYVVGKNRPIANNLSIGRLSYLINRLLDIDVKSKSSSINTHQAILQYLLAIN